MKKMTFFVAAMGIVSLTACKKDYECACDGTYTVDFGYGNTQTEEMDAEVWTIESVKEDEAEEKCDNYESQFKNSVSMIGNMDIDYDVNCSTSEI